MIKKLSFYLLIFVSLLSCSAQSSKPIIVVTSSPIAAILNEIAGPKTEVFRLVPPGASPHTYQPKPSDMYKVQASTVMIYVAENADGWAASLPAKTKIKLMDLLPDSLKLNFKAEYCCKDSNNKVKEHDHSNHSEAEHKHDLDEIDPHFWTDPLTVAALVPILADTLAKIDPDNAKTYRNNAQLFIKKLMTLHKQIDNIIQPIKGKPLFTYHPSFNYFINRYKLVYSGSIEESPGKEPSPQFIANLTKKIKDSQTKAVFSEPQLSDKSAKIIAEAANIDLFILDPNGGTKETTKYSDLLLYNARILRKALE